MTIRDIAIAFGYEVNKGTEKAVKDSVNSLKSFATKALGAIGLGISLTQINAIIEEFQGVNQQIKYATNGLEDQAGAQERILEAANATRQDYAAMATTVTDLMNTHNKLFKRVEDTAAFAELTNKAFKSAGANESEINSLNNAIQNAFTTGKVSAGSFQTMMTACPKSVTYLSKTLGITEQQVKALGTAGAITANQLYTAFTANADAINDSFGDVAFTITDALKYIKNEFGLWITQLNETYKITHNIAKFMVRGFDTVMSIVKKLVSWIDRLSKRLGGANNLVKLVAISAGLILAAFKGPQILDFLSKMGVALKAINLKTILIVAAILAVALVVEDFIQFLKGNNSVTAQFFESIGVNAEEARAELLGVLSECKDALLEAWGAIKEAFGAAWEAIKPALKEFVYMLINILTQILPVLCDLLSSVARIFANIAKTVLPALAQILTRIIQMFSNLIDDILPIITDLLNRLMPVIEKFISDVLPTLVDFVSQIINLVLGVIEEILPVLIDLLNEIVPIIADIIENILPLIADLLNEILPLIVDIIDSILPILVDLIKQLIPFITQIIKTLLPPILNLIKQIIPVLTQIISKILPVITKLLDALLPILSKLISSILPPILELIQAIVPVITEVIEAILPVLIELIDLIVPILEQIIDLLMPILDLVLSLISPLLQIITDILKPILNLVVSLISPLLELVMSILRPLFEVVTAILEPLFTLISAILEPLIGILKTVFGIILPFVEILTNLLGSVLKPIINVLTTIADIFGGVFADAISTVTGLLQPLFDILSGIMGFVGDILGGALDGVTSVVGGIVDGVGGVVGGIVDGVSGVVGGIADGIGSAVKGVGNFFGGIADTVGGWFGLAEGGYIGANNPVPVVIGDNKAEGEIVSPISKMKNTMLDALGTFAYAAQPIQAAGTLTQQTNTRTITQNVNITNQFSGGPVQAQRDGATAMRKSANDATGEMARALAYAR